MKLNYQLSEANQKALALGQGERILYCVPVDLSFDNAKKNAVTEYTDKTWLVVTNLRFAVLQSGACTACFQLKDCEKIKC